MGYIGNFIVYTLAMVGVIVVALLVFKNATSGGNIGKKSKYLQLIDTMSLGQRKMLYIVSTGREKFLIAGDVDKTTLISKLDDFESNNAVKSAPEISFKETMASLPNPSMTNKNMDIGIKSKQKNKYFRYAEFSRYFKTIKG